MAIEQFEQAVMLAMKTCKHFPKPAELRECLKSSDVARPNRDTFAGLPPRDAKWLCQVNGLFLQYLSRRRLAEKFAGDINLAARRAACLDLVAFFDALDAESDPEASPAQMAKRFESAMARIPDAAALAA